MNFEVIGQAVESAKIKVVGVGGAGGNAVIHMMEHEIQGPEFICANTDAQALLMSPIEEKVLIGRTARGRGAGGETLRLERLQLKEIEKQ